MKIKLALLPWMRFNFPPSFPVVFSHPPTLHLPPLSQTDVNMLLGFFSSIRETPSYFSSPHLSTVGFFQPIILFWGKISIKLPPPYSCSLKHFHFPFDSSIYVFLPFTPSHHPICSSPCGYSIIWNHLFCSHPLISQAKAFILLCFKVCLLTSYTTSRVFMMVIKTERNYEMAESAEVAMTLTNPECTTCLHTHSPLHTLHLLSCCIRLRLSACLAELISTNEAC